jgi:chromosome segregation ATPase
MVNLHHELELKSTEIARLNSLNENQIAEIYALNDKNNRNSNQIDALTTHEADLETEKKRLSMQLSDSGKAIEDYANKLATLKNEFDLVKEKNETLCNENQVNLEKLSNMDAEKKSIESKYSDSQFELNSLNDRLKDLIDNINTLNNKLEKNEYAYNESCNSYENKILLIRADNEGLKNEIQNLEKSLQNELENQRKLSEEMSSTNHVMKDMIMNFNKLRVCQK